LLYRVAGFDRLRAQSIGLCLNRHKRMVINKPEEDWLIDKSIFKILVVVSYCFRRAPRLIEAGQRESL
jgi:hypothetical protein